MHFIFNCLDKDSNGKIVTSNELSLQSFFRFYLSNALITLGLVDYSTEYSMKVFTVKSIIKL